MEKKERRKKGWKVKGRELIMGYNNKEIEGIMLKKEVDFDSIDDELSFGGEEVV